ncbi:unnamed protein product [Closterium sp. NIES-54]
MTMSNPGHVWLRAKWLQSAFVLILDNEATVQDQALDLLASLLLQPLGLISASPRPSAASRMSLCKDRPLHVCVGRRGVPPAPVLCEGEEVCEMCARAAGGEGAGAAGGGNAAGAAAAAAAVVAEGSVRSAVAWLMAIGQGNSSVVPLLHRACAVLARRNALNARLVEGLQAVIEAAEGWQNAQLQQQQQQKQPTGKGNSVAMAAGVKGASPSSLWRCVVRGAWLLLLEVTSFSPQGIRWEFLISRWRDGRKQQETGTARPESVSAAPAVGQDAAEAATPGSGSRVMGGQERAGVLQGQEKEAEVLDEQEREAQVHVLKALCNVAARIPGEKAADVAAGLLHNLRSFQLSPEEAGVHMVALATLNRHAATGSRSSGRSSSNNSNSNSNRNSNSSIPVPGSGGAAPCVSESPEATIAAWCLELCQQATEIVQSQVKAGRRRQGSPDQNRAEVRAQERREEQQEEEGEDEAKEKEQQKQQEELEERAEGQPWGQRVECAVFVCGQLALIAGELAETHAAAAASGAGAPAAAATAAAVAGVDSDSGVERAAAAAAGERQGGSGKSKGRSGGSRKGASECEQLVLLQSALKEAFQCLLELLLGNSNSSAPPVPVAAATAATNPGTAAAAAAAAAAAGVRVPVLAHGWLALGRFSLVDHALAKTCVPLFVQAIQSSRRSATAWYVLHHSRQPPCAFRPSKFLPTSQPSPSPLPILSQSSSRCKQELQRSPIPSVRNNLVVVFTDLCVRYTDLAWTPTCPASPPAS